MEASSLLFCVDIFKLKRPTLQDDKLSYEGDTEHLVATKNAFQKPVAAVLSSERNRIIFRFSLT